MNLIDKAVEQYRGVWPKFDWPSSKLSKNALVLIKYLDNNWNPGGISVGDITLGGTAAEPHYAQVVCTEEEFKNRAKELGWINGYKRLIKETTSWHERGELPPVGVDCEAVIDGQNYEACTVIAYFDDMVWLSVRNEKHPVRIADKCKFRPIKSPKEKAVENALEILSSVWDDPKDELVHVLETLFDAELLK